MNSNILQWKNEGYTLFKNLLSNDQINKTCTFLQNYYLNNKDFVKNDFGSNGVFEFPSNTILDLITLDETIIEKVKTLLNSNDILLVQSDTWGKNGSLNMDKHSNTDQRMHMDYGNNTFLHPPNWENPEAVAMIIYFSDINNTEGGTSVVPKNDQTEHLYKFPYINMPGIHNYPFINDKTFAENYFKKNNIDIYNFRQELYKHEKILKPNKGDILFYRLDLWHRGTPVRQNETRFVMNLLWKKKECYWINNWNPGWTKKNYYGDTEKLFTNITPIQRSVLGVPLPGDKYWNNENIKLLKNRYPEINIKPYLSKL